MIVRERGLAETGQAEPLVAEAQMFRRPSEWRTFWEAFSRDRLAVGAGGAILLVCLVAAFAPLLSPYDPTVGNNSLRLAPIGTPGHLLGLDGQGRDILSRLIWGGGSRWPSPSCPSRSPASSAWPWA